MTLKDLILVMYDDRTNWHWGYTYSNDNGYPHSNIYDFKKLQLEKADINDLKKIKISCITSKGTICVSPDSRERMLKIMESCSIPIAIIS